MVSAHVLRVFPTFGQCRRRAPGRRRQPPVAGVARQWKRRAVLGIEPRTSRTLRENHTTRPNSHLVSSPYSTSAIVTDVPFHAWRAALHASCQEAWPLHCGASLRHGSRIPAAMSHDTLSEWLRRWTRNPLGPARRSSNPLGGAFAFRTHVLKYAHHRVGHHPLPLICPAAVAARERVQF